MLIGIRQTGQRLADYYRDPDYFRQLYRIGIPIAFQQAIFALLNMVSNVMVGQRGDVAMTSVWVAGQVFFLLNLFLFGLISGSAMVTAQLWGKMDVPGIRRVLALCVWLSLAISGLFIVFCETIPVQIASCFSTDAQVLVLSSQYLRVLAGAFPFLAVSFSFSFVLRSMGKVALPVLTGVGALGLNILLSWLLLFGKFGLPEMGVLGVAWATVISRVVECFVLLAITYVSRSPAAITPRELFTFDTAFLKRIMKPVLPVILNEFLWSLGITTYNSAYGHIGLEASTAMNIMSTVDGLAMAAFMGLANATSVMVGNKIGAGETETAYRYAGRSLILGIGLAIVVGVMVLLIRQPVIMLYKVSPGAAHSAYSLMFVLGLFLWIRMTNTVIIMGLLRAGGDTRFSLILDGFIIWILGVPMALLGVYVFHLPIQWVYLMVMSEEVTKFILGMRRYFTRKWIHDLTHLSSAVIVE